MRGASGFLLTLGGHIELHYAVKVGEIWAVNQNGVPGGFEGGVSDPFLKVVDLHALFKGGH